MNVFAAADSRAIILGYHTQLLPQPTSVDPRLGKNAKIKAVLFDVYGTLIVSGSGDVGSANEAENVAQPFIAALEGAGIDNADRLGTEVSRLLPEEIRWSHKASRSDGVDFPEVDILDVWKRAVNRAIPESVQRLKIHEKIEEIALRQECLSNPTSPMPGAQETIKRLNECGIVLGIVSNAQYYTPLLFKAYFDANVEEMGFSGGACAWSYKTRHAKPSTVLFEGPIAHLQTRCGISASEILYVGNDMLNDIWTANRCGCVTALFAGDRRSLRLRGDDERVSRVSPDFIITDLGQLGDIVC